MCVFYKRISISTYMPNPDNYESQDNFMRDCISISKDEGDDHETAVAKCLGMWSRKDND